MNLNYLDFEQPIADLEEKIQELKRVGSGQDIDINEEISRLEGKCDDLTRSIFSALTPPQIVQMARHPLRPYTLDYIDHIFTDFNELHGDRHSAKAAAMIGGIARLEGKPVVVLGHQKGRSTKDKLERNFGMASPEGFRKALRLMKLAEKFSLPVITFIDTPGAYPGITAEEHNQSEAIARNLFEMSQLRTPILCVVTGEGCSGGALGIGVGDRVVMLQYSYYAVISPEGCASILWKSAEKANEAAQALGLTSERLLELGLIDEILPEPMGGAHRDPANMAVSIKDCLLKNLLMLEQLSLDELLKQRYDRLVAVGR